MYPSTQKEIKFTGQSRYKEDFIDVPKMDEIRLVNSEKITRKEMKQVYNRKNKYCQVDKRGKSRQEKQKYRLKGVSIR